MWTLKSSQEGHWFISWKISFPPWATSHSNDAPGTETTSVFSVPMCADSSLCLNHHISDLSLLMLSLSWVQSHHGEINTPWHSQHRAVLTYTSGLSCLLLSHTASKSSRWRSKKTFRARGGTVQSALFVCQHYDRGWWGWGGGGWIKWWDCYSLKEISTFVKKKNTPSILFVKVTVMSKVWGLPFLNSAICLCQDFLFPCFFQVSNKESVEAKAMAR